MIESKEGGQEERKAAAAVHCTVEAEGGGILLVFCSPELCYADDISHSSRLNCNEGHTHAQTHTCTIKIPLI